MDMAEVAVLFDFDGVLVNTGAYHRLAWIDLAKRENLEFSDEFFESTFGMQNYQIIPDMTKRKLSREEIDALSDWKETRFRELITGGIETLEGVQELLAALKADGIRIAIGSSTPRVNLDFLLGRAGLEGKFDAEVSGEEVRNGKPAPDTFLKAAEKLNMAPGKCVVIEDAVTGVKAAKAAGCKVIAITTTRKREELFEADMIIDSMAQLSTDDFRDLVEAATA